MTTTDLGPFGPQSLHKTLPPKLRTALEVAGQCTYCGDAAEHRDHFVPRFHGGSDDLFNLVPACRSCNSSKGRAHFGEWVRRMFDHVEMCDNNECDTCSAYSLRLRWMYCPLDIA